MGCVDRTPEFRQMLTGLQAKGFGPGGGRSGPQQATSEFNAATADIGAGIHRASQKVQELQKMAKQKGIFNDKSNDISQLTCSVKDDLQMLDQKIDALERRVNGHGKNKNYQAHTKNSVTTLKTRLGEVANEFREALESRTSALEQQDKRRQMYASGAGAGADHLRRRPRSSGDDLEGGGGGGGVAMQQVYQSSRAEAVQHVQSTIGELATMFQKMAVLVSAQEEGIQRIEEDVDGTLQNVQAGQEHLLKYFKHMSSNRALIIKVLLILIFFVVFFVVFLA